MTTATPAQNTSRPHPAACPFHAADGLQAAPDRALGTPRPDDMLLLPMHQRIVAQYARNDAGATELRLFHGDKEISFDEPELFAFGEQLARQSRFIAIDATTWGDGQPWSRVQPLLAQLLDEGVLRLAGTADETTAAPAAADGDRPSPLPTAPCHTPASWWDSEAVMQQLTGRPLETGWLELVLPIFRVAHMALDADGRQVGESNVFPPALRLDVPTRWRGCIYAGTRFQVDRPMNVTALKAMRAHWGPMMALLQRVRAAYLRRYPAARAGWTVGHLERLATAVLALPTYQLMRADKPVANGALHPVLSSLFRVTDGLRMTMHQMLFVPIGEPTLHPDAPMDARTILDYAERNYSFHSEHGVCAGPRVMIDEFLQVLVDGQAPRQHATLPDDPALQDAVAAIEPAMDYALLGLQAYAAVFSLWPAMARSYLRLAAAADAWAAAQPQPGVQQLQQRLQGHLAVVQGGTYLAHEDWRSAREQVYGDMWAQCDAGLAGTPGLRAADATPLDQQLQAADPAAQPALAAQLAALLAQRCGVPGDSTGAQPLADEAADFLLRLQAVLRTACSTQARINQRLGRSAPRRPFSAADVDLHNQLQGATRPRLPYLVDELQHWLGATLDIDARHCRVTPGRHLEHDAPASPDSACTVQAGQRASRT